MSSFLSDNKENGLKGKEEANQNDFAVQNAQSEFLREMENLENAVFTKKSTPKSEKHNETHCENEKKASYFEFSSESGAKKEAQEYGKLEKIVQKYEGDIRELIRSEHQLRILAESLQEHLQDSECAHMEHIASSKQIISVFHFILKY